MDNTRSPRYPSISLAEAISKARLIYDREHMSPGTPVVMAEAMGYRGINGSSLKVLSSLRKFNLLEGRGEQLRITKDAQELIIDQPGSPEYRAALTRCALNPELFSDLKRQFPTTASERNIAVYLEKQGFKPDAAALCAKNYKETIALVGEELPAYNGDVGGESTRPTPVAEATGAMRTAEPSRNLTPPGGAALDANLLLGVSQENEIKVLLDGNRLRVAAWVDAKGLKRLKKILDANEQLIAAAEEETAAD